MYIYKITNKLNGKWYIGKTNGKDSNYMGSGKILKQAYKKYGRENFEKVILEHCSTEEDLNLREAYWITSTNATTDPNSYNLVAGGTGGDRSKFIPYSNIDYSRHRCEGATKWYKSLTTEEKAAKHARTADSRARDWYVSRVNESAETLVHNIAQWCKEHGIGTSFASASNNPTHHLYQKQSKGWRIRRSDMPLLPPYENKRGKVIVNNGCRGRSWKLVDGKRIWYDK